MTRQPHAYIIEEFNGTNGGGATWWTLYVGSITRPVMSASYCTRREALAEAPMWCPKGLAPELRIEVVPLIRDVTSGEVPA